MVAESPRQRGEGRESRTLTQPSGGQPDGRHTSKAKSPLRNKERDRQLITEVSIDSLAFHKKS